MDLVALADHQAELVDGVRATPWEGAFRRPIMNVLHRVELEASICIQE